jgi:hypothetical protein
MDDSEAVRRSEIAGIQAAVEARKTFRETWGTDAASLASSVLASNEEMRTLQANFSPAVRPISFPKQSPLLLYDRMREHIKNAEQALQPDQQLEIQCSIAGDGPFVMQRLEYHGVDLLIVYGVDGAGNQCEILAHPNAVQFVIRKIKSDGKPKRSIGFKNGV